MPRAYRLGRRQPLVDRTERKIVEAARLLLTSRPAASVSISEIARLADVSRATVYQRFGSRSAILALLSSSWTRDEGRSLLEPSSETPQSQLRHFLDQRCRFWGQSPALHRHLDVVGSAAELGVARTLAERLAAVDALRPGCSIREAEDVISAAASFAVFDRLHHDGRRSVAAVAAIAYRLACTVLA